MSISTSSHSFRISELPISLDIDTRLSVQSRREHVIYLGRTNRDNINLAYSIAEEVNSDNNLSISDRSNTLAANRIPESIPDILFNGGTITLSVDKFQLTDIFTPQLSTQLSIPLYFKHILKNFNSITQELVSVKVVDDELEEFTFTEVVFDNTNGIIYNNLLHEFDSTTGESTTYFIKYTVRTISGGAIESFVEILDNENIFVLATVDDLDGVGRILPDRKVYLVDEITSSSFEVTTPLIGIPYSIRETPNSRIRIIQPSLSDVRNPWFVKTSNGQFFTQLPNAAGTYRYSVPEFTTQLFNPEFPYKTQDEESSYYVNHRLVKLLKNNIYLSTGYYMKLEVFNEDGTPRLAFSTDPLLIGTPYTGDINTPEILYTDHIRSIDRKHGFLDLDVDINDTDILKASYTFEEVEYEITDIDFNPFLNRSILAQKVVFYTIPNTSGAQIKTIYYLLVNRKGIITASNNTDNTALQTAIGLGTLKYQGVTPSFEQDFSIEASNSYQYFVLAEVMTTENSHPEDATLFDVRKKGGGIKDIPALIHQVAETTGPEIIWTNDIAPWNGFGYPGSGSFVVEVPASLQQSNGGRFTDPAIREIIERHSAAGTYAVARAYTCFDIIPSVVPTDTTLELSWRSYGAEHTYNVYIAEENAVEATKVNVLPLTDNPLGNTYTITALTPDTNYWVYIICLEDDKEYPNAVIGTNPTGTTTLIKKVLVSTYA